MKKTEIEKKYKIKEFEGELIKYRLEELKTELGLEFIETTSYEDIYYDNDDILEAYKLTVRKRVENGSLYFTLKEDKENEDSFVSREKYEFTSLEELIEYLKTNYKLVIESLYEKMRLKVERQRYRINYKGTIIEINFDKSTSADNKTFMLECKFISGNINDFLEFNLKLKSYNFLEEIIFNKKELNEEAIVRPVTDPFSKKVNIAEYRKKLDIYFASQQQLLEKLKKLNKRKERLKDLHARYGSLEKPIVVTISGTPRAGKTTCIDNLFEFFKKANFKTACVEEPAGLVYATLKDKEEKAELLKDRIGFVERQLEIGETEIRKKLNGNEILLCDRGILDTFIWYDMYYKLGMMDKSRYQQFLENLKRKYPYITELYILYTSPLTSMYRDYQNSLSLEPRSTMNEENVRKYNSSLIRMVPVFERNIDNIEFINTTDYAKMDASILIANDLTDKIESLYRRRRK